MKIVSGRPPALVGGLPVLGLPGACPGNGVGLSTRGADGTAPYLLATSICAISAGVSLISGAFTISAS